MSWTILPVHVSGPVAFGYTTVAGHAGERPSAVVTVQGKPVEWPVPQAEWYIVTAVGDPAATGAFITVLGSSFADETLVDYYGGE
jgi:hypothetical protein